MSQSTFGTSAYGGDGWSPRVESLQEELGGVWASGGIDSEWRQLKSIVLHCPGNHLGSIGNHLMLRFYS